MIDINLIRENKDLVKENIKKKFQDEKLVIVDEVYDLDKRYRDVKKEADTLRSEKNKLSEEIGLLMRAGKKDEALKIKVSNLDAKLKLLSEQSTTTTLVVDNLGMYINNQELVDQLINFIALVT